MVGHRRRRRRLERDHGAQRPKRISLQNKEQSVADAQERIARIPLHGDRANPVLIAFKDIVMAMFKALHCTDAIRPQPCNLKDRFFLHEGNRRRCTRECERIATPRNDTCKGSP